jgi:cell division protein FtsA
MVGRKNEHGKIEIVSMGRAESLGVMRGTIANIDKTVESIKKALQDAEDNSEIKIKNVYVGIAGQHIKSLQHRGIITRDNTENEISRDDIKRLSDDMRRLVVSPGDRIIQVLPQEFIVDNEPGIKDPVGMCGVRLEANFHIITGQISAAQNIIKCVEKAGFKMIDMILEPLASADAVLTEEEKEAGVVLVDIGGGTTDVAIFQDGIIRHTHVIPFGGNIITEDIKDGCQVLRHVAEALKVNYGSAIASDDLDNQIVSIPGLRGKQPKEISVKNLAHIINARMEEIIEDVDHEIRASNYRNKLIGGIVLTGGGSQLKNLVQLVQYMTGLDTRIGYPIEHIVSKKIDEVKHPMYATCIGLLLKGFDDYENKYEEFQRTKAAVHNTSVNNEEPKNIETEKVKPPTKDKQTTKLSSFYHGILGFFNDDVDEFNDKK